MRTSPAYDCKTCDRLACVCDVIAAHAEGCMFRLATTCAIPVECDHGRDVCPECDPCTCKPKREAREPELVEVFGESTLRVAPRS